MRKKPVKKSTFLYAAVCWTVASAAWIVAFVMNRRTGSEGLIVLNILTACLGAINSVINWTRYVNFEEKTETEEA